jgi:glucuronate isomerase
LAKEKFSIKVLPTFRPDKVLNIQNAITFKSYIKELELASKIKIVSLSTLLAALKNRVAYFNENGCKIADHGLIHMPASCKSSKALGEAFEIFMQDKKANDFEYSDQFAGVVLLALSKMYFKNGWVQQFHLGAIRNNNTSLEKQLGADAGADSMGDYPQAVNLSNFLNTLEQAGQLAKTILYNSNAADNDVFATMCGNYNEAGVKGKAAKKAVKSKKARGDDSEEDDDVSSEEEEDDVQPIEKLQTLGVNAGEGGGGLSKQIRKMGL